MCCVKSESFTEFQFLLQIQVLECEFALKSRFLTLIKDFLHWGWNFSFKIWID